MNVGIVCDELSFTEHGGSNYSIHRLATELAERGHNATVLTLNLLHENDAPVDRQYSIQPMQIDHDGMIDAVKRVYAKIDDMATGIDVFHVYYPRLHSVFGAWRLRGGETPVVGHLNSYSFCPNTTEMADGCWNDCTLRKKIDHSNASGKSLLGNLPVYAFDTFAAPRLMNCVDRYVALSPQVRDIYVGAGVDEELIDVVPNMVDPTFEAKPAAADGGTRDVPTILYAGRTDPSKGVNVLVDALARVDAPFHADIVGDDILDYGHDADDVRADVEARGLDERVDVHGWVKYENLPDHYGRADIFVHPGQWPEPFGRTLLEAMAHDCAVITSDVGAPPWVTGGAGATFPRGDADALAKSIETLLASDERLDAMQANCAIELDRFDPEHVTDEYLEAYKGAL